MMNPYASKLSTKNVADKISKIMKTTSTTNSSSGNKKATKLNSVIGQKLEGLNQILHSKVDEYKLISQGRNLLNEDDFITLEDKMKLFQDRKLKKSSSGGG